MSGATDTVAATKGACVPASTVDGRWRTVSLLTATLGRRPVRTVGRPKAGPRRDIQGLRAFAVVAVVLDHLVDWPRGGFVGVDVFFVLSGFLITGLLLREHERTGRISFGDFYRRRVKRIVPAATIVIVATVVASWFVFTSARFGSTLGDAVYALLFAGNWRFALQSTDYFSAQTTSPLQQYWSLGVEEQFYLVWPLLLLAVFAVMARRGGTARQARKVVGAVLGVVVLASFAWALYETAAVPDRAYFSTFSRTWELGVGALLAVAAPLLARLPGHVRPVLSWTGPRQWRPACSWSPPSAPSPLRGRSCRSSAQRWSWPPAPA